MPSCCSACAKLMRIYVLKVHRGQKTETPVCNTRGRDSCTPFQLEILLCLATFVCQLLIALSCKLTRKHYLCSGSSFWWIHRTSAKEKPSVNPNRSQLTGLNHWNVSKTSLKLTSYEISKKEKCNQTYASVLICHNRSDFLFLFQFWH